LCKWHSDDPDPDNGRPSELADHREDIMTGAQQGMTLEGCARLAGVDESTLHRWINKYDDFRKSLKRARAHGELQHLQSVNDSGSRFILERSFGYVKTEKREVEAEVSGGGIIAPPEAVDNDE
jgi:transposase-like protein